MRTITKAFTEHPASVGESYFQHMGMSMSFAFKMLAGGCACLVHAFFPFLCVKTGSTQISKLHDRMVLNRDNNHDHSSDGLIHSYIPEYFI
jgi:hypothetical protein